ncbi:hypothetical protein [Providencia alcalifaciens]|uniref:hypothetical protein n=1 Tax=Providencia alcalifaciens TaxID=126385 RepID=UPI00044C3D17|nr:hypothetical protein [Providencia alcalifaciens]EUD08598.1 hypothetical protein HMPREF1564_3544 [Providencia alcalifaciens R90-1475]
MHEVVSVISDNLTIKIILAAIWTAVSFLAGAYVGHRFNLFRDKRNEFNDACRPAREILMSQLCKVQSGSGVLPMLKQEIYWVIRDNTPSRKRKQLDKLWSNYCQSNQNDWGRNIDEAGYVTVIFKNKENYMKNIQKLLDFIKKK